MSLYSDSAHRPSAAIDALHSDEIRSFSRVGTWGSAAQRTAVVATARKIWVEAGLQQSSGDESLADSINLPAPVQRLIREVALGGISVDRTFCQQVQSEGVTEGAYVEIVSLVSRLSNLDVFARGLGVSPRPLAAPIEDTAPSFKRPAEATDEGFFTASVPNAPTGGALAESLYGNNQAVNVFRAVSLVPDEARRVIALIEQQYFPGAKLRDFEYDNGHALSRAQVEIVATKVSEHNQCFY
jgi:guanyl-specific ribonuclease Sa